MYNELQNRLPQHIQALSDIRRTHGYLLADVGNRQLIEHLEVLYPLIQDGLNLPALVRFEEEASVANPGVDFWGEMFREVESVGDGNDYEVALSFLSPVEQIIEDLLVSGLEVVEFVENDDSISK